LISCEVKVHIIAEDAEVPLLKQLDIRARIFKMLPLFLVYHQEIFLCHPCHLKSCTTDSLAHWNLMCLLLAFFWGNKEWHKMAVTDFLLNCGFALALLDVSQRNFASDATLNIHTTPSQPSIGIWLLVAFLKKVCDPSISLSLLQSLILSGKVLHDDIVAQSKLETTKGSSNFAQFPEFAINRFKKIVDSLVSFEIFLVSFLLCR
jgi:hypothetical protein